MKGSLSSVLVAAKAVSLDKLAKPLYALAREPPFINQLGYETLMR